MAESKDDNSALAPLRSKAFSMLWSTWVMANMCMWMNDVAAAWLMTSLTSSPLWVALVQSAATLPVFLLALPSGALADSLDRKRYFLITQLWGALVACALSAMVTWGHLTPSLLLLLVFANGVGLAMRWPVFAAIVPELVGRQQLPAALALQGIAMNVSRIFGPLLAGAIIAAAGSAWVFALNSALSLTGAFIISRWRRTPTVSNRERERFLSAMRVGLQYVAQSTMLRSVLWRICVFYLHSTAVMGLLALLAKGVHPGGAGTFTVLLACMGSGAIVSTSLLPVLRKRFPGDRLIVRGAGVMGLVIALMALSSQMVLVCVAMFFFGSAWMATANTLSVAFQLGLPDWVRARGMSICLMTIMGSSAAGAALWGQVATWTSVSTSLWIASICSVIAMVLVIRLYPRAGMDEDHTPEAILPVPIAESVPAHGHIMVTIEYEVNPQRLDEFRALMLQDSRRLRLQHGALSWELLHDLNNPGRFVEVIVDASWADHLRRFDRITAAEVALRDKKLEFHIGNALPKISRHVMASTVKHD